MIQLIFLISSLAESKSHADVLQRINHSKASLPERHSSAVTSLQTEHVAGQVVVMGPDDLVVSVAR